MFFSFLKSCEGIWRGNINKFLEIVRKRLSSIPKSEFFNDKLHSASIHLLNDKAKLVRAKLILSVAEILKNDPSDFVNLAMAVELLHTSSLIHDDIIDKDRQRRGIETVNIKYGNETAMLAGDALIARAVQISSEYGGEVTSFIAKSAMRMCAGEQLDYEYQKNGKIPNLDDYLNLVGLKCGALIAASCAVVPLYTNKKYKESLYNFGENIGIAFQIRDDIADFIEEKSTLREEQGIQPNIIVTIMNQGQNRS